MATGIGVTIGSSTVRAVEVRKKGVMWQVTNALVHPLTASDDAGRVAEARAVLQQSGMKGTSLVGLSGKDLIVRYTKAPRVPDWRLEMLMGFEIAEVAEQSGGDVAADWALLSLPAAAGEDDTVLVALSRNTHLKPRLDALSSAGIGTLGGCPRSLALYHAFISNCEVPPGEVTMIVHLGGENTDVAIQRDGALLFARNLAGGGKPFTDALQETFNVPAATAEKMKQQKGNVTPRQRARYADSSEEKVANTLLGTAGTVVSAVHSSLMFCKAQTKLTDLRVDRVLVSGAGSRLRGMCEYLASSLGIPVEPFEPFETLDTTSLPPEAASSISESGISMAAALGLAQMAAEKEAFASSPAAEV
ncbi:MAG: pilus assembly protein PilM [Planctomycetota bacterium]|jgi:type IV pilus assembly protein PilM